MSSNFRPTRIAPAVAACCLGVLQAPSFGESQSLTAGPVNVIATTPLPGLGVDREHLPFPAPSLSAATLRDAGAGPVSETLSNRVPGVNVNEIQGNPWQADLNYRGFTASPLLGTAQGLSVYLDGVRVNEAFGDVVNWDLMPSNALAGVDLVAGSNPAYGLNTLGGALALRTKGGFTHPGGEVEAEAGAFGRRSLSAEYGRILGEKSEKGEWAAFIAASASDEDGWRDHSPSHVRQLFAKLSRRDAANELDVSLLHADNDLTGNGLLPDSMRAARRESVFTVPDNTLHRTTQVAVNAARWIGEADRLEGTAYLRDGRVRTLNGDVNDDFEGNPALDGAAGANGGLGFNQETAANNRTRTEQRAVGVGLQWTRVADTAQTTVGAAYDHATSDFRQSSETGVFDADRRPVGNGIETVENQLSGRTRTASVFVTGLWHLSPQLHLSASGRYNETRVTMRDELVFTAPNLDGDHRYRKFNPALGAVWDLAPAISLYGGFNQGSRAPTPLELGCADPANPCTLPNALAADPFLEQVVTRTVEAGLRGGADARLKWRAGAFRSENRNDILFVGTSTSAGYFTNFGKTRRTGLEFAVSGKAGITTWEASANWLRAEYASSACLLSANNSSRGQDAACTGAGQDDEILVSPGDRLPGIPERSLKLAGRAQLTSRWQLGGEFVAYSGQFVRGNENNRHEAGDATDAFGSTRTFEGEGRTPGYAVVNLRTRYDLGAGWQLIARINNVFDRRYATGGALAENPFDASGNFLTNADDWRRETFTAPGAPRAVWVGVNWRFAER
jgi:outer membrane receptor protein involved in Fe transport